MKSLTESINESLKYVNIKKPKTINQLKEIVLDRIEKEGNNCDLNDINVSKVTDMSNLFGDGRRSKFNGDISKWDVSNVTNMYGMFGDSEFNGDISKWDVSKVTDMGYMFLNSKFNGDISAWDVSNVTNMYGMFNHSIFNGDISKWDVSNVIDMGTMFKGSKFNGDISKWNVSNGVKMDKIFYNSKIDNQHTFRIVQLKNIYTPRKLEELQELIKDRIIKEGPKCNLNDIDVSLITDMSYLFHNSNFNGDISKWDVSNVTDMYGMFMHSKFNGDISKWDVSNVKYMHAMFSLTLFNNDISKWNVSNVQDMNRMFSYSDFNKDISNWNVSKVTDMSYMFTNSKFNKDISNWNTDNVKKAQQIFKECPIKDSYKPNFNADAMANIKFASTGSHRFDYLCRYIAHNTELSDPQFKHNLFDAVNNDNICYPEFKNENDLYTFYKKHKNDKVDGYSEEYDYMYSNVTNKFTLDGVNFSFTTKKPMFK